MHPERLRRQGAAASVAAAIRGLDDRERACGERRAGSPSACTRPPASFSERDREVDGHELRTGAGPARLGEPPAPAERGRVHRTSAAPSVMPIRGAIPVLDQVATRSTTPPLGRAARGATLLAMQLVAVGSASRPTPRAGTGRSPGSTPPTSAASPSWRAPAPATASTRRPPRTWSAAARRGGRHDAPTTRGARAVARARGSPVVGAAQPRRVQRPLQQRIARIRREDATTSRTRSGSRSGSRPTRRCWTAAAWSSCSRPTTSTTTPTSSTPTELWARAEAARLRRARPAPTPPSRCAPRPTSGRPWTGCSDSRCPTGSCSTPTSLAPARARAAALDRGRASVSLARGPRPRASPSGSSWVEVARRHPRGAADGGPLRAGGALRLRLAALALGEELTDDEMAALARATHSGDQAARQLDGDRPAVSSAPASG